ncbi:MAG: hypothetical protein LBB72_06470 [Spirochaetaceae bacterium]|nr:hypothetical protein [Spirochaetaceae bacterium]
MKKMLGLVISTLFLCVVPVSCDQAGSDNTGLKTFSKPPEFTSLSWDEDSSKFVYRFEHSDPRADSYDVCWRLGERSLNEVLAGTKIENSLRDGSITPSTDITMLSAVVAANKSGYSTAYSDVECAEKSGGVVIPVDPPYTPTVVQAKSVKRGVGYNFVTLSSTSKNNATHTARDMDLLMSGTSGICWFYSWGAAPNAAVETAARERSLEFAPMAWNAGFNDNRQAYITFANNNPGTKYLLAFNEPNFPEQSNMTPAQAAAVWPNLRALAADMGSSVKIVSPAMNFGSMMGPVEWLDQFRAAIGEAAWSEIEAISVHTYPWWPSAVRGILQSYRKYNKKIWLTEFCGWEDVDGRTPSPELQAWYVSMALIYLEADPMIGRYAWYLPKGHVAQNAPAIGPPPRYEKNPFHNLITEVNASTQPQLTDLGIIYANIPSLDKGVWYLTGEKIDASQFMDSNLAEAVRTSTADNENGGWSDSVLFRPVTDNDKSAGVLEIWEFKNNMWVEYQVEASAGKVYNLSMRYKVPPLSNGNPINNNTMRIYVDGTLVTNAGPIAANGNLVLPTTDWTTAANIPLNLSAGKHSVRLLVTGANSNFALNWLVIE